MRRDMTSCLLDQLVYNVQSVSSLLALAAYPLPEQGFLGDFPSLLVWVPALYPQTIFLLSQLQFDPAALFFQAFYRLYGILQDISKQGNQARCLLYTSRCV